MINLKFHDNLQRAIQLGNNLQKTVMNACMHDNKWEMIAIVYMWHKLHKKYQTYEAYQDILQWHCRNFDSLSNYLWMFCHKFHCFYYDTFTIIFYSQALSSYTNKHITIMYNAHDHHLMVMSYTIMILVVILKLFMSVNLTNIFLQLSNFHIIIFRLIDDIYHDFSLIIILLGILW